MNYSQLTQEEQLTGIDQSSFSEEGVLIFKHSTRCPISSMVWRRFKNWAGEDIPLYYLDLLSYRNISEEVANRYNVRHESPQLLWIKNGECLYSASHTEIEPANLKRHLNDL